MNTQQMLELKNLKDSRFTALDLDVKSMLATYNTTILAGGAVRDTLFDNEISDYDVFFTSLEQIEDVKAFLLSCGFSNTFTCPLGQLFTYMKGEDFKKPEECVKVQLIVKRVYHDVWDLINSFDFSATYFALKGGVVYTDKRAIKDVRKKQLSLVNLEYPSSSINRLWKYRNKGYYVGHVIKEIVQRVSEMQSYDAENDTLYVD